MKNQLYSKFINSILLAFGCCVLLMIPEMLISDLIFQNDKDSAGICYLIMCVVTAVSFGVFIYVMDSRYEKLEKERNQKEVEEAKNILNSEFITVYTKDPGKICNRKLKCQAKVGDDKKIICKIQTDFEMEFDNYEKFLECFQIPKKE